MRALFDDFVHLVVNSLFDNNQGSQPGDWYVNINNARRQSTSFPSAARYFLRQSQRGLESSAERLDPENRSNIPFL